MQKYRIGLVFERNEEMQRDRSGMLDYREISVEEVRAITDVLTRFDPTPVNCAFNSNLSNLPIIKHS